MTATSILDERNAEIRRVMLEKFGQARFVSELGAEPVASDDFGQLYSVDIPGDELLVMVRVENSTPDPDGSRREYWLRVDPDAYGGDAARVPQAAVASTWRYADGALVYRRYGDYRPVVET